MGQSTSSALFGCSRGTIRRRRALRSRWVFTLLALSLVLSPGQAGAQKNKAEEKAAKEIVAAMNSAHLRKLLVADFLDAGGVRTEKGVYLAARFAKDLSEQAPGFALVDREKWVSLLESNAISPNDVAQPGGLRRIGSALGCDAVATGLMTFTGGSIAISVSLRDVATGRELALASFVQHQEPAFEGQFPATVDDSGMRFYFPGFDGVSEPYCARCAKAPYGERARRLRIRGSVFLSVLVGSDGRVQQIRLLNSLDTELDHNAIEDVKHWEFEPALDSSGRPVPVRFLVEMLFGVS
jgi:TonB family protein